MPYYDYYCENCNEIFEVCRSIKQGKIRKCLLCKKLGGLSILPSVPSLSYVKDTKTVGSWAEKNTKLLGAEQIHLKEKELKRRRREVVQKRAAQHGIRVPDLPEDTMVNETTSLDLTKIKDVNKYIETGKTS